VKGIDGRRSVLYEFCLSENGLASKLIGVSGRSHVIQIAHLDEIERLIRRDPARRGLVASEESRGALCPGHLAGAAADLAANGRRVLIVTGFFIPSATPPAAETDGPPGAAMLAAAFAGIGMQVQIATDDRCRSAVEIAVREMGLPATIVAIPGSTESEVENWFQRTVATEPAWSHLIAIERVGPSHTQTSIEQQTGNEADQAEFEDLVPAAEQNHCYNMRGVCLDDFTAPLHRLFELADAHGKITTIGIGDGGNEIGMGSVPWQELRQRLNNASAARTPCRISTDWTIVAGVSNWGGMALAAATLLLRNRQAILLPWTTKQQLQQLERLVFEGPAVDGITRLPEPTVDGLPFLTYIQPWEGIRRAIELPADDL